MRVDIMFFCLTSYLLVNAFMNNFFIFFRPNNVNSIHLSLSFFFSTTHILTYINLYSTGLAVHNFFIFLFFSLLGKTGVQTRNQEP